MHINLSLWFNFQELNTTASQCLPSLLCTAILCSSLCILIANRPIGFTHPLDFGDLHPASNCCSSSLLNIDVTSFQPRKLAPWTYTEKQTSSLIRITDLQARSVAASADSGWPIGSNSPTSGVLWSWEHSSSTQLADGCILKTSRLGYCSKSSFRLSKEYKTLPVCRGWQMMPVSTAGLLEALLQAGVLAPF